MSFFVNNTSEKGIFTKYYESYNDLKSNLNQFNNNVTIWYYPNRKQPPKIITKKEFQVLKMIQEYKYIVSIYSLTKDTIEKEFKTLKESEKYVDDYIRNDDVYLIKLVYYSDKEPKVTVYKKFSKPVEKPEAGDMEIYEL